MPTSRSSKSLLAAVLAALFLVAAIPAVRADEPLVKTEEFHYRWRLQGLVGVLAGLFMPRQGDGSLVFSPGENGHLVSELLVTSEKSESGEFWRYGSEVDLAAHQAVEAWSSYKWRGKSRSKKQRVEQKGVLDIVAGIYVLRQDPPELPRKMKIWSDGKIYPVLVIPKGEETRRIGGKKIATLHLVVKGIETEARRRWKGSLELWLARDEARTPVEIRIQRSLADLDLELQNPP